MNENILKQFPNINLLNPKELQYFLMMLPKYGVLYLQSEPGIGKSAIARSTTKKLNMQYIELRLSMIDETDIGLYPIKSTFDGQDCIEYVVPKWALLANKQPTIIHFEELNRAPQAIRNAALQILLERCIGYEFCFNSDVYMMASGNYGDEDNTIVEDFDAALNGRLIHVKHKLPLDEWIEYFAKENVFPDIIQFLEAHPAYYYQMDKNASGAYASARSWTFLSEYIKTIYGNDAKINDYADNIASIGTSYVGSSIVPFINYLRENQVLNINHVINEYDSVKELIIKQGRAKQSELLNELSAIDLNKIEKDKTENIFAFLDDVTDDERTGYLLKIINNDNLQVKFDEKNSIYEKIHQKYYNLLISIRDTKLAEFGITIDDNLNADGEIEEETTQETI